MSTRWLGLAALLALAVTPSWATAQVADYPALASEDWPWWRGPGGDGIVRQAEPPPTHWSATEGIVWSADVPGRGNGSPIVVGDRVILATCDEETGSQSVLAYDRKSGKQLWHKVVHNSGAMRKNSRSTGASVTPAFDGERIYVNFANGDAAVASALSMDGQLVWQTRFSQYQIHQGYGASPALYKELVLVAADAKGGGAIAALNRRDGQIVWKRERPSAPNYPSPIVHKIHGKDQLLMTGCDLVTSLDPLTGQTNWELAGATTECVTTTITDGERIFTSGGYPKNHMSAVKADGSKEVVWENKERVYVPSLLVKDGYLYGVLDAGVAMCWESATGKEMWKKRLGGNYSASPVLFGDLLLATSETGETHVLRISPQGAENVAKNKLGDEAFATPTISRGQIFMRYAVQDGSQRNEKLVCIGK